MQKFHSKYQKRASKFTNSSNHMKMTMID